MWLSPPTPARPSRTPACQRGVPGLWGRVQVVWEGLPQRAARTAHHLGVFRRGKGTPKGAGHCGSRVEVGAGAVWQRAGAK